LDDGPQDHQTPRDARQDQAEASAIEEVPAIPRRLDVAGRHVRVPNSERREGLRDRVHGRQVALQDKVWSYLHKSAKESIDALKRALRKGRTPRELYLDNGKQFIAKEFKREARSHGIRLIFGKPYHPGGRGKIENYHKVLWKELISQVRFDSLAHFKSELRKFDRRYNHWRKQEPLRWNTPASIYNDKRYFNRQQPKTQR